VTAAAPWPPAGTRNPLHKLARAAAAEAAAPTPTVSARLADSLAQLQVLRSTLVSISATGAYSPGAYIKARAFVVLAHGVIEEYLEGICLEVVDAALNAFNADGKARVALLALLHYTGTGEVPDSYVGGPWGIRKGLKGSRQVLFQWAEKNNGIKEKDVLRLLLPAGLKETDMTSGWLAAMSDLGEMRGFVAHRGHPQRAQTPVDPKDALDHVEAVVDTLCRIDAKLVMLRNE
jgi:hypothetical protein